MLWSYHPADRVTNPADQTDNIYQVKISPTKIHTRYPIHHVLSGARQVESVSTVSISGIPVHFRDDKNHRNTHYWSRCYRALLCLAAGAERAFRDRAGASYLRQWLQPWHPGALYPPPPSREKPLQNIYRACLWLKDFADEIEQETGIPIGYERRGRLEGILKESQKTKRLQECTLAEQKWQQCFHQPPMQMISATEARQIEPNVIPTEHGALLCHVTAQVNPQRMLSALRKVCELRQVRSLENIPVHTLNLVQDRIQGVQTGQGIIPATTVLICAGAWSAQLHPILQRFTNILRSKVRGCGCRWKIRCFHIIMYGPFYLIRTSDTEIILGSTTEPEAGFDDQ